MPAYKMFTTREDLDKWMAVEPKCSFEFRPSPRGKIGAPPLLSWQALASSNDVPGGDIRHEVKRLDDDKRVYCQFSGEPAIVSVVSQGSSSSSSPAENIPPVDVDPDNDLDVVNYARELVSLGQLIKQNTENSKLLSETMTQALELTSAASESLSVSSQDGAKLELYRQGGLVISMLIGILRQFQDKKLPPEDQEQLKEWRRMKDSLASMGTDLSAVSVTDVMALEEIKKDPDLNQVLGILKKKIMSRHSQAFTEVGSDKKDE